MVKLTEYRFHCLLLSRVRVALLLFILGVTLRLLQVLGGLGVPPIFRPWLNAEMLSGASFSFGQG